MSKIIQSVFTVVSFISVLASCSTNSSTGPCDYTSEKFNMHVLDVSPDPADDNLYIILVDFDGNISYAEGSHTMGEVRNVKTDLDFVVNNNIRVGSIYTGTVHQKIKGTGNCEEEIIDWGQKLQQ